MSQPSRRQILSVLAGASGGLLAGCAGERERTTQTPTETDGESAVEFPDDTTSDACPSVAGADRTVCYDAIGTESIPVVLVPETQTMQPDQPTEFTLQNRSGQELQTNFYDWQIYKRVDGNWYYIIPESTPLPLMRLEAGGQYTWTVTLVPGGVSDSASRSAIEEPDVVTVTGLGGGHYAFVTNGSLPTVSSGMTNIALAAGFDLHTDPLELTTTEAITETEWDGETLIARTTRGRPLDTDDQRDAYVLERIADSDTTAEQVIIEQVVRNDQLRDAIALSQAYDAERVRLEEFSRYTTPFGLDGDVRKYEFRGNRYQVRGIEGGGA